MNNIKTFFRTLLINLAVTFLLSLTAHAETYNFNLQTTISNNMESAVLTATTLSGSKVWTYYSGSYPAAELSHFALMTNNGYVYLVENGSIKQLDFFTGNVNWTNSDFKGSPAKEAYTFSSSGKLYIAGYYGPDLFVVDTDGTTIARVNQIDSSSYHLDSMWFYDGDYIRAHYDSNNTFYTFNVLNYFGRMDGLY